MAGMNLKIPKIRIRSGALKDMSLIRRSDRLLAAAFVLSVISCIALVAVFASFGEGSITNVVLLMSVPFFLVGLCVYIEHGKWPYLLAMLAADAVMYFAGVNIMLIFFISFVFVGAAGVVGVVVLIQRVIFYRVVEIVEYLNVKEKLSIRDRIVVFFFSVPNDLDTRTITMNYNLKRASIPWNEMASSMLLGLMIGMFLWIYMSMNPAFMSVSVISDISASAVLFLLVLYIPLLVLPWSIFKSLNVRVETRYRDFALYDGIKETLKRMTVPMFASFVSVLVAINTISLGVVFMFIVLSVIFNVVIIGLTSLFFYVLFEAPLVDDIVSRWKIYRPVSMTMDIGNDIKMDASVPATPERDMNDYGKLEFPEKR